MNESTRELVTGVFKYGTAEELMSILRAGAELVRTSTVPLEELDEVDQSAIATLQVVLTFLTDFGVLEDVQVRH